MPIQMDRVRSDLKQHQLDPKLAQNREGWRKGIMAINPDRDKIGKGTQNANTRDSPSAKSTRLWRMQ